MNYIVRGKFGRESCKNIAAHLKEMGCKVFVTKYPHKAKGMVVRWGWIEGCAGLNSGNGLASRKFASRMRLQQDGIPTPKTAAIGDWEELSFPILLRPYSHFGGNGWEVAKNKAELVVAIEAAKEFCELAGMDKKIYAQELMEKDEEIRVHVFGDGVLMVQKKELPEDHKAAANFCATELPTTVLKWSECKKVPILRAIEACKSLGCDFGAVDMFKSGKKWYVLEVNTAPHVTGKYTSKRYAMALNMWFNGKSIYVEKFEKKCDLFWGSKARPM